MCMFIHIRCKYRMEIVAVFAIPHGTNVYSKSRPPSFPFDVFLSSE